MSQLFDMRVDRTRRYATRRDPVMSGQPRMRVYAPTIAATGLVLGAAAALAVVLPIVAAVPVTGLLLLAALVLQRHALADLAAGATLLLAQPYAPGERVRLLLEDADGNRTVDAEVLEVRLLRTVLCTGSGMLAVRNAHMLRPATT